jgi:hypothetical protein
VLKYPDVLRIDLEDTISGNFLLWRNDSLYRAKRGQVSLAIRDTNALLHVLGGWRLRNKEDALLRWKQAGITTDKCYITRFNKRKVLVLGAANASEKVPQVWIDVRRGYTHRALLRVRENDWQEIRCSQQKKIAGKWVETFIEIYQNETLIQKEYYQDIQVDPKIDHRKLSVLPPSHR